MKLKEDLVIITVDLFMFWEADGGGQEIAQSVPWAVL